MRDERRSFEVGSDRALLVWMTRLWPSLLSVALVVRLDNSG